MHLRRGRMSMKLEPVLFGSHRAARIVLIPVRFAAGAALPGDVARSNT
tara:strand:+ start:38878 stop:39021 length:144 start_codon:yes stop_codon:yes gene_type:complete